MNLLIGSNTKTIVILNHLILIWIYQIISSIMELNKFLISNYLFLSLKKSHGYLYQFLWIILLIKFSNYILSKRTIDNIWKMNARERILKAINHEEPDRVPSFELSIDNFSICKHFGEEYVGIARNLYIKRPW